MANAEKIKSVTNDNKVIAVDGAKLDLEQNSNTSLNDDVIKPVLSESLANPVQSSAEDEVAAIQQALVDDQTFDPTTLEAPAAGAASTGVTTGNNGHTVIDVEYLTPVQTPDSGFETIGISNNDVPILDFSGEDLILAPQVVPVVAEEPVVNRVPAVQVTDHNGLNIGDNEVLEGAATAVNGNFELDASEGVLSITVAGIEIPEADLLASGTSPIDIATAKGGVLSIDGYNETSGVVNYSYLPDDEAKDHSAGDNSIVDQFELTVTDDNNVTSSPAVLDILIKDTVPQAFDNVESLSQEQAWLADNVINNARNGGDNAADDLLGADGAKLQSVSFLGDTRNFLNPTDIVQLGNDDFIQFDTDNGTLYIRDDGQYWYNNTTPGGNSEVTDSFEYQLIDGDGDFSVANLTITQVLGENNTGDTYV